MRFFSKMVAAAVIILPFAGIAQSPRLFSPAELQQDHDVLITSLKEAHPGLYRFQDSNTFNRKEAAIRNRLTQPMTERQYYNLVMPLITSIHCGHTKWHRQNRPDDRYPFDSTGLFPLKLYFAKGKAFVVASFAGDEKIKPGTEITKINGLPIRTVMDKINSAVTADGFVQSALYEELNHSFNGYYATFVKTNSTHEVEYRFNGKKQKIKLAAVARDVIRQYENKTKRPALEPLRLSIDNKQAVLTIERFFSNSNGKPFDQYLDSAFLAIKQAGVTSLVLDLRNNEGGVEEFGGYLYSYLAQQPFVYYRKIRLAGKGDFTYARYGWFPPQLEGAKQYIQQKDGEYLWPLQEYLKEKQPQPNAYNGKLYVLLNGLSFSVTTEFAAVVKSAGRATFVGEESGGTYEGDNSGVFASFTLPNTKLTVGVPLLGFYMNVKENKAGRGIMPDVEVVRSVEDVLVGRDVVMERVVNGEW